VPLPPLSRFRREVRATIGVPFTAYVNRFTRALRQSTAQAETRNRGAVPLDIFRAQVCEQPATTPDELEQPTARVMVVVMQLEVLDQLSNTFGEERDLYFRRASVSLMDRVINDDIGFLWLL